MRLLGTSLETHVHAMNDSDTTEIIQPAIQRNKLSDACSSLVKVEAWGVSHTGKVRPNNEDHFLIGRFGRFLESVQSNLPANTVPNRSDETGYGMIVADGLGGNNAGEEASRIAISSLVELILRSPDWILRLDHEPVQDEILRRTSERYEKVNEAMVKEADFDPGLTGYGTTMTLAFSLGSTLFLAHIGDSRAYLLSQGRLHRLTKDHTVAQNLVDQKIIDRKSASTHHLRNVLTKSLGDHGRKVEPDVSKLALDDNDCLLLCTDGLTDMVSEQSIAEIVGSCEPVQTICNQLVAAAMNGGGKDNITVIVARYRIPQ
jgi:PPM family protein phosphatase